MKKIKNTTDLRVRRTRKLLWEALMTLLANREFESITVNAICDEAMVHRTTFYNHYQDKYDLLNTGMLTMYEELTAEFASPGEVIAAYQPGQPPGYFVQLFQHVVEHKPFYAAMLKGGGANLFREHLETIIVAQSLARLEAVRGQSLPIPAELIAHFNSGAIINALVWWAQGGFALPAEQMAQYVMRLIAYGNFSLFDEA